MLQRGRLLTILLVVLSAMVFLAVGALTATDAPDEISIQNEGYAADKKGPVKLSHKAHVEKYGAKCNDCHHAYKDGKNVWKEGDPVQKCSECHDPKADKENAKKLQTAYHKNCKDCHKEYIEKNPDSKAPYKKCNDCHEKK